MLPPFELSEVNSYKLSDNNILSFFDNQESYISFKFGELTDFVLKNYHKFSTWSQLEVEIQNLRECSVQ